MIDVGSVRLQVLHTPGHRPEHCALTVIDTTQSSEPVAVLTGDSLFVGDVARPDLAVEPRVGARDLHRSLERLAALSDSVEVLPGHIGGSLCGSARMSTDTRSTIGAQRRHNQMFVNPDEEAFVARADLGALAPASQLQAHRCPQSRPAGSARRRSGGASTPALRLGCSRPGRW